MERSAVFPLLLLLGALFAGCNHSAAAAADGGDGGRALADGGDAGSAPRPSAATLYDAGVLDEQIPATTSDELTTRARHLLEAIAHDNPDLGADMLFPRDAWVSTRDVADPGRQWDAKVSSLFRKQLHRLHRTRGIDKAQFISFELGHAVVQTVPKHRDWKKPLWKVRHSKLTFMIDGKTHRIDVAEMIGWRGAWYVTRLSGA